MITRRIFLQAAILTLLFCFSVKAQVGIGNTNPNASLDISASNQAAPANTDGILIPRVDAFSGTNPGANQNSMIVYLTTTDGSSAPGFYFWEQSTTSWQPIDTIGNDWKLAGNTGTTNGTDFIGTTDGQDLDIRTNDNITHRFTQQGQLEFINTGNAVFIGEGAGENDDLSNNKGVFIGDLAGTANTTGANNTFLGYTAGEKNTSGSFNTAVGAFSVDEVTTGQFNTGIGNGSLGSLTTGSDNTSIGAGSMNFSTTAVQNTALGSNALQRNATGIDNVAIGDSAGALSLGSNNVFVGQNADRFNNGTVGNNVIIGQGAGDNSTTSHALEGRIMIGTGAGNMFTAQNDLLVIENSSSATPLIGGDFVTDRIGINLDPTSAALTHTLTVGGNVYASGGFQTPTNTYPDYVFEDYFFGNSTINGDYSFTPLVEAIKYVKKNGHLPNVKSFEEVQANGMKIDLGSISVKNLEKIEENFLYIAELKMENEQLSAKNQVLETRLNALEAIVKSIQ